MKNAALFSCEGGQGQKRAAGKIELTHAFHALPALVFESRKG